MSRLPDAPERRDRAVSAVVGFVLIFGVLVITFSLYQAQVVPQQNSQVEFEQHQEIQQQMVELRSNIVSMQGSTSTLSTAFDLGVRYPSRTIFVNPGPASGSLRTKGASDPDVNVTLRNVTATDSENDETADFWDGTKLNYSTSIIEYEPDFNRFQGGLPVVYEHSLIYNRVEDGDSVPITDQSLINGNRINLIALNGTLAESGVGAESVDLEPVSTRTRVVEVNNKSGPITLEFASLLNASVWNETLEDQPYVESVKFNRSLSSEFSILELKLEPNRDYELKLSKVGLGTGATDTTAEYLTEVEGAGATVLNDSTQKLTVEARDRFNGPQSGVTVEAAAERGSLSSNRKPADSDGQATFVYDPDPDSDGTYDVYFTIDSEYTPNSNSNHDASTRENVTMSVKVTPNSGGRGGGGGAYKVRWDNSQIKSESGVGNPNSANRYNYSLESGNLSLTMFTDPVADNATVEYAVNDTSTANLTSTTGVTDASGKNATKLQPQANGVVKVYTSSGSSGDEIQIKIKNVDTSVPSISNPDVVYADGDDKAHFLAADGSDTDTNKKMKAVGPISDFDGDGTTEVLVVGNNGKIKEIENSTSPNVRTIPNTEGSNRALKNGKISVGDWDDDGTLDIFYGDQDNNLRRVERNGSENEILVNSPTTAVAGFGDITGDGAKEVVYTKDKTLQYFNGSTETQFASGLTSGKAVGPLADYNGKGTLRVAIVTNGEIALVGVDGTVTTIKSGEDTKDLPMAAANLTGDSTPEIAYVPNSANGIEYTKLDGTVGSVSVPSGVQVQQLGLSGSVTAGLSTGDTTAPSILGEDGTILYQKTNEDVAAISGDGGAVQTLGPSGVNALGPIGEDLDSDGAPELAYVDNRNLKITDIQGNVEKLVDSSDTGAPGTSKALMATETWDRSGPSVFYAGSGSDKLYRTNASTPSPIEVADPSSGANAVLDTGDIDGDGSDELVFVGGGQVRYLNSDGNINKLNNGDFGSNNGLGAGELITIDGTVWVTLVDGSNNIKLVTDHNVGDRDRIIKPKNTTGGKKNAAKSPITTADVDDDGNSEIVYLRKGNNKLRYVDNPLESEEIKDLTKSGGGGDPKADSAIGVVSG